MSTFTDGWNGPEGGVNYIFFRRALDELRRDLTDLEAKLPAGNFTTSKTVEDEITRVELRIPPLIDRLDALDREVKTKKLTIADGNVKLLDVYNGVFKIYQDLEAANIDVKNIKAGPALFFDKAWRADIVAGIGSITSGSFMDYYVLAELEHTGPDTGETGRIRYPCTLYVYNNADPKVSAVIYATETGLAVLHSGRDFPSSGTPGAPPRVKYAVVRTGSSDGDYHYYVCMAMYQRGTKHVDLMGTALKVAMINARPVTAPISGVGMEAGDTLETSRSSDFLVSHLSITDLVVSDMHATNLTVDTTSDLKGDTTIGTQASPATLIVNGDQTTIGDQTTTGKTTTNSLVVTTTIDTDTIKTKQLTAIEHITTPEVRDNSGTMLQGNAASVTVGAASRSLDLVSNIRPTVKDAGKEQEIAYRSDLASSIVYKGSYLLYSRGVPAYIDKIQINDDSSPAYYMLQKDDLCLALIDGPPHPETGVTEAQTAQVYKYVKVDPPGVSYWEKKSDGFIPHPTHDQTYQWHITYLKQGSDIYFHQSEVLWNPDNDPGEIVSYVNLPLEDYYTKEQIEKLVTMFYDLSTRQADWFATNRTSTDDWRRNGIDNPAYIRNKPLTGISVLDGGPFVKPPDQAEYPQWIVDGGDFNTLGKSRGTVDLYDDLPQPPAVDTTGWEIHDYVYVRQDKNYELSSTRYKIKAIAVTSPHIIDWEIDRVVNDIGNFRQDVVLKVWSGERKDLPQSTPLTKYSLKWCYDTRELFIDMHGEPDDGSFVNSNKRINIPEITALYNASIALGTDTDATDPARRILSTVQTFNVSKSNGNATINFKLVASDNRLSFDTITHNNDLWIQPVAVFVADLYNMVAPYTVATQATSTSTSDNDDLVITWVTNIYGTLYTKSNKTESVTFIHGNGITLAYDGTVPAATKLTIGFDSVTQTALDGTPVLKGFTTDSGVTGNSFKFGLFGDYLRVESVPFNKEIELKVGDGLVITPDNPQVANKPAGTINMSIDLTTALEQNVVLSSASESTLAGVKITTKENKFYKPLSAAIIKTLTIRPDTTLKMDPVDSAGNDLFSTIGLSKDTIDMISTPLLLGITATGAKFTVNKGQIYGVFQPDIMTYDITAGAGIAVTATNTNDDTVVEIGLSDGVLSQAYLSNISAGYNSTDGLLISEDYRTIGDSTQTQKTIRLLPGANMTFVEVSGSTATNRRIQLNATMDAPSFESVSFTTDPAAVTGKFTAGRTGLLVNGVFTIENIATGTTTPIEGQFQETLAVSLSPITPMVFECGDSAITNATLQYLKIDTDGHVSFRLGPPGSKITVPFMYFGQ